MRSRHASRIKLRSLRTLQNYHEWKEMEKHQMHRSWKRICMRLKFKASVVFRKDRYFVAYIVESVLHISTLSFSEVLVRICIVERTSSNRNF